MHHVWRYEPGDGIDDGGRPDGAKRRLDVTLVVYDLLRTPSVAYTVVTATRNNATTLNATT